MKNWIQGAVKHPGALHDQLGVPQGQPIPQQMLQQAAQAGGKLGERARFAENMHGMQHAAQEPKLPSPWTHMKKAKDTY